MDTVVNVILKTQGDGNLRKLNQELTKTDNVIKKTNGQLGQGLDLAKQGRLLRLALLVSRHLALLLSQQLGPNAALAAISGLSCVQDDCWSRFCNCQVKTLGVETGALIENLKQER